jgi:hypothetical protein
MNVSDRKKILKDLNKISRPAKYRIQENIFEQISQATGLQDIIGLKKI